MTEKKQSLLDVENVSFAYGSSALIGDVSLSIHAGEFLCLLGPSGCGKSTLLRLISGLERPDAGGVSMPFIKGRAPKIGMVFQDLALFPHMSVARNVGYALRDLSRGDRRARTDEMLGLVNLSDKRGAYPHELSGGQKQRLALARALASKPDLILLDEPFAAQDVSLRAQMRDDVMHILRDSGVAAVLVTHDPEEAMQFADRIAIMQKGRLEQIGTPFDVYNHPKNAFVASFFGQVNKMGGVVENGRVQTPLGPIPAPHCQEDMPVDIIIRPEAVKLSTHDPAINHDDERTLHHHGYISERKYLGRSTLVHLDTYDIDRENQGTCKRSLHLHSRMPGTFDESEANIQDIFLDHSQVFVFPKAQAQS